MTDRETLQAKEADCTTVADFAALAQEALQDPDHRDYVEELAQKAEGLCVEVEDTVAYAGILHQLGRDANELRSVLEEAEMDCQFTKQFVALARGFQEYCQDEAKVAELMEQAEEFCMTDEEQIDLGDGFQLLLKDPARAAECYEKGLVGIQDKEALLALAEKFAGPLNNPDLARTVYERAEQKMNSGNELRQLAQSILEHLKDKEAVGAIYQRAAESITASSDLINLAADSLKLGLDELANQMYHKVLDSATDCQQVMKLLPPLQELGGAKALIGEALDKARELADDSAQLLGIAEQAQTATGDVQRVRQALQEAEERVTSLGELTAVIEKVEALAGDDAEWRARLDEKREKRKANQARYNEFQNLEKKAESPLLLIQLAVRVKEELDDAFYVQKLLSSAQALLDDSAPDVNLSCLLARTVDQHLKDIEWTERIMRQTAEKASDFATLRRLAQTACGEISDSESGHSWTRDWYQGWQKKLNGESDAYAWVRLARAVLQDLNDAELVAQLLEKASSTETDAMAQAQIGVLARDAGDMERARQHFESALGADTPVEQKIEIVQLLHRAQVDDEQLRELYQAAKPEQETQKLRWVEGILEAFHDPQWGQQAYDDLMAAMTDTAMLQRSALSRESRLGRFLVR